MTTFKDYLNEQLKNPDFKNEWDALEPEFTIIQAILDARQKSGLTQKELSEKTGITQAGISRLEKGNANPALSSLFFISCIYTDQFVANSFVKALNLATVTFISFAAC